MVSDLQPDHGGVADANRVSAYLDNSLNTNQVPALEQAMLESDRGLAELWACQTLLSSVLSKSIATMTLTEKNNRLILDRCFDGQPRAWEDFIVAAGTIRAAMKAK